MRKKKRLSFAVLLFLIFYVIQTFSLSVRAEPADEKIVVVLDAGHGGIDGGTDTGLRTEKEYNLLVATYLYETLSADERFEVIMTRTDDQYIKFLPRVLVALENNADIFISLHFNSSTATYVHGNMAYCSLVERYDAHDLAEKLLDAISSSAPIARGDVEYVADTGDALGVYYWDDEKQWDMPGASYLGMKSDYYSINTWASKFGIPSIIVEHGYLSNKSEAAVIDQDENLRAMAKAQAEAIIAYYTNHTHTFGVREIDFPSNCTMNGTSSYRCTICGMKSGTETLPAAPEEHYWRQVSSTAVSCTTDGTAEYVCQIAYNLNDKGYACEVHSDSKTYAATGHSFEVTEDVQAAHGVDGVHTEVCRNCGETVTNRTPGEPHSYTVTKSIAPLCETDGKTVYTCSICGASYEETISASGHSYEEISYVHATTAKDGTRELRCTVCGDRKIETESSCQHQYSREETPATCVYSGKITETCLLCGYVKEEVIPAVGHDYIKQMDVASTCKDAGFYKGKCAVCGHVITETREKLPHSFEILPGTSTERCTVCGFEQEVQKSVTFVDWVTQPIVLIVVGIVVVQLAVVGVLASQHRSRQKMEAHRRRKFAESDDELFEGSSDDTDVEDAVSHEPTLKK